MAIGHIDLCYAITAQWFAVTVLLPCLALRQ